ncbi:TPA: hypothetical protein NGU80_004626 [Vibrio parahaemolyticus]|uniref:hypothetical protein n=8 Tax=Vibrio harveyi group TaxID=717610 RepID=UPI000415A2FF|nr:hypothetical protein [Vibrio parahaemolyticus]EIF8963242.1 hypothetical protein [Vibrio parahaemolyticus]EIO4088534.1 hypothetical protein [Vibrio parahaemolyticus]TOL54286.1 hypothetical protein CGH95_23690 [Vibrio parahaemolyticus]HCE4735437.1 hypothetical protein [Vibrio parahaemolyticus]HCG9872093.1 hypothetical protein [Vibrio parahaemolyticus]
MHPSFSKLYGALDKLKETIDSASIPGDNFIQQYGWNQTALSSSDLCYAIENMMADIKLFDIDDIEDYEKYLESQVKKVEALDAIAKGHYNNNAGHLIHLVPNIAITILIMQKDLEKTFFAWEEMEDKKLLPRHLARRLRSTEARLSSIDTSSSGLEEKIGAINNAHEAAESLPTDLEELKRTQKQISELLQSSKEIMAEIQLTEKTAEASLNNLTTLEESARTSKEKTDSYVEECDKALQITTTEGLAAGFDEKAKELSKSINKWVGGLIFALIVGGIFGAIRVQELTTALATNTSMSFGEGLIQAVLTIFSIGGPLWFAWLATQQITQRFKLSEDYSYKATVAKSYTGFSKQANRFGADVEERLFNATLDRLEEMPLRLVDGKDYNSPWHEFVDSDVVKQAITMVPGLARELNLYAKNTQRKMPKTKQAANQPNIVDEETLKAEPKE